MPWITRSTRSTESRSTLVGRTAALLLVLLPAWLGGCAPTNLGRDVAWTAQRHDTADASLARIAHWPCKRADEALLDDLRRAADRPDLDDARAGVIEVLERGRALARASVDGELDRLPDAGWRELRHRHLDGRGAPADDARSEIRGTLDAETSARFAMLTRAVAAAPDRDALDLIVDGLFQDLEPTIKERGRVARALPFALFSGASAIAVKVLHDREYRGPMDHPFEHAVRYEVDPTPPAGVDHASWDRLRRHAPRFVQEIAPDADYPADTDRLGTAVAASDGRIEIDTARPAVYGYERTVTIGDVPRRQLVYTLWYPRHPALKGPRDPEAGHIEGTLVRVTLDDDDRPLLVETLYACGCHHRVYPTQRLEHAALDAYGPPDESKRSALERAVGGRIDLVVPKVIGDGAVPVVRCCAGHHAIIDVDFDEGDHAAEVESVVPFTLRPYEDLERLPLPGGGITSMFHADGLVKGAARTEGIFFTPIGMLSAGQPRQRGTQLVHWDQWDLDDPHLFTDGLRWPAAIETMHGVATGAFEDGPPAP